MICIYDSDIWETPVYNKIYTDILEYNNRDYVLTNLEDSEFWEKVEGSDLFIYRFVNTEYQIQQASSILPTIEKELDITTFPRYESYWHFDDKIKQYYLLKSQGYPIIDSYIFWNYKETVEWIEKVKFPKVFKLKSGAGSSNVILVKNKRKAKKLAKAMFRRGVKDGNIPSLNNLSFGSITDFLKSVIYPYYTMREYGVKDLFWKKHQNYCLFQDYLPDNDCDIRITVIGDYAYGFLRYTRDNDFRASGSGKLSYDKDLVDKNAIEMAFSISEKMNFDSMAYDFIYDGNKNLKLCEISYTYLDEPLYQADGIWNKDLNWIEGNFWPGYLHLKMLLQDENLEQPDISLDDK